MEEQKTNEEKNTNDRTVISFLYGRYRRHLIAWTALFLLSEIFLWNSGVWNYRIPLFTLYVFIFVGYIALSAHQAEKEFWERFAADHDYTFARMEITENPSGISLYCAMGRKRKKIEEVAGMYNGNLLLFSSFSAVIGEEKTGELISFTMCETRMEGNVPSVILISQENTENIVLLKRGIPEHKELTLEGDFNKYFSVYTRAGKEREALEILTPDIMIELIKYAGLFSFEFNQNRIFVCGAKNLLKREELEKLREISLYLAQKLSPVFRKSA
ncbi:MAG: hypothetical protein WC878_05690 [Candidatus Paceibacterota bacterium]|jgi:hypothetical protein